MNGENARTDSISSPKNSIAERLAARGREDVDDAAADGELPALVGALDPLVAGEGERLRQTVDAGSRPGAKLDRLGPRRGGGSGSASAARRRADEAARLEDVSARARSPTRCGGGSSPDSQPTPRLGSSPTASSPRNQAAASAASRASASSGSRHDQPAPEPSCSDASRIGSAASETRARVGRESASSPTRSSSTSSPTKA